MFSFLLFLYLLSAVMACLGMLSTICKYDSLLNDFYSRVTTTLLAVLLVSMIPILNTVLSICFIVQLPWKK